MKTIGNAIHVATEIAKRKGEMVWVISAETHDGQRKGEFALCEPAGTSREHCIVAVSGNGKLYEGPAAQNYPVGVE